MDAHQPFFNNQLFKEQNDQASCSLKSRPRVLGTRHSFYTIVHYLSSPSVTPLARKSSRQFLPRLRPCFAQFVAQSQHAAMHEPRYARRRALQMLGDLGERPAVVVVQFHRLALVVRQPFERIGHS